MQVVHLTTTDFGGAYKAAVRISKSMEYVGVDSKVLVRTKSRIDTEGMEVINTPLKKLISKTKNVGNLLLSEGDVISDYFGTDISKNQYVMDADVVFLHWVNSFVSYHDVEKLMKLNKKIVWVMHDMWLFTGGCHCDQYCGRYIEECGFCPLSKHKKENDISRKNFYRKQAMLNKGGITLVGPSNWLVECAKKSNITKGKQIFCIANPIDDTIFYPRKNEEELRDKYGLPIDKKVILFGAMKADKDINKGITYLKKAIDLLSKQDYVAVVFGNEGKQVSEEYAIQTFYMGKILDENALAELYNCADVFVAPSFQESFGYTICEALSCGIPVVAFPVGGILDQIEHKKNGYLAKYQDVDDIVRGIEWAINEKNGESRNLLINDYKNIGKEYLRICKQVSIQNKN